MGVRLSGNSYSNFPDHSLSMIKLGIFVGSVCFNPQLKKYCFTLTLTQIRSISKKEQISHAFRTDGTWCQIHFVVFIHIHSDVSLNEQLVHSIKIHGGNEDSVFS